MAHIDFDRVTKRFGDVEAVSDLSLHVDEGDFLVLLGPSGCGKSTLLRIASGLTEHTGGVCDVNRDSIGYVFQDATLLPWRTVQRNVELLAELEGAAPEERSSTGSVRT